MTSSPLRLCFFGDSMVNGTGDDACLGWVGRACAAARRGGRDITCYNLGIRRDTSEDVLKRWESEAKGRLPADHDGRLVFSFGTNDACPGSDGAPRVAPDRTLTNAEAILAAARAWRPTLMVGPLPICDPIVDARTAELSLRFAGLCDRLGIPFLPVIDIARTSEAWAREVATGDGAHPNEQGYALIAQAFTRWPPWKAWVAGLA
nr:GDSL-type esterase/lipase family protein [uncultured Roseococcus sp.]